jgi:hypothetical protein
MQSDVIANFEWLGHVALYGAWEPSRQAAQLSLTAIHCGPII